MTTRTVATWGTTVAVTQEARDDLIMLDTILVERFRRTVPEGFEAIGEPWITWSENMFPDWTDEETGEIVRGPEWVAMLGIRVVAR